MTTIAFDAATFRALFPPYSNATIYPDALLQMLWDNGTNYITDQSGGCNCCGLSLSQQTYALNLMTAHLLALNNLIAAGQTPGIMTAATIDKISVAVQPPPSTNNWQYWLNETPYGRQLLALLKVASVGGCSYGGFPVVGAFRR